MAYCRLACAISLLSLAVGSVAAADGVRWRVDRELGIQLAYLPADVGGSAPNATTWTARLPIVPVFAPDISNIGYADIRALGFPLPLRPAATQLKLYLKLYHWPATLDARLSTGRLLEAFLLPGLAGGPGLVELAAAPANVGVKYAYIGPSKRVFSAQSPLPLVPPAGQEEFDSSLPFSSIYVQPAAGGTRGGNEAQRASRSAAGVLAFHQDLLRLYGRTLLHLGTDAKGTHHYYARRVRCLDDSRQICGLRVFEVPAQPLVFANYRQLPMPQDPRKVFLSGLLLVKLTDYGLTSPQGVGRLRTLVPGTPAFAALARPGWSHMLEVASVLDLR